MFIKSLLVKEEVALRFGKLIVFMRSIQVRN